MQWWLVVANDMGVDTMSWGGKWREIDLDLISF